MSKYLAPESASAAKSLLFSSGLSHARPVGNSTGGFADEYGKPVPMESGNNDLKDAYRHSPTEQPEWSVVAQVAPGGGFEYFTMPGFNFGMSSAVPQFNRTPELS